MNNRETFKLLSHLSQTVKAAVMTQTINLRRYQESDLEQCRSLWRELVEWHRKIYSDSSIGGDTPELFFDKHLVKVGADGVWVAAREDSVVGLIGLEIENEEGTIEPVIVSKNYRGQGVGKRLVEKAVDEARKRGVKHLNVMPVVRNKRAIHFLHEMGFNNLGHVQLFMDLSGKKWKSSLKLYEEEFDF